MYFSWFAVCILNPHICSAIRIKLNPYPALELPLNPLHLKISTPGTKSGSHHFSIYWAAFIYGSRLLCSENVTPPAALQGLTFLPRLKSLLNYSTELVYLKTLAHLQGHCMPIYKSSEN
jgi:hypothetical protein